MVHCVGASTGAISNLGTRWSRHVEANAGATIHFSLARKGSMERRHAGLAQLGEACIEK